MYEEPSIWLNPAVMILYGIPLIIISVKIIYHFTRWVFSVKKQIHLLEGIYEKMGGDIYELYASKKKSMWEGTSFEADKPKQETPPQEEIKQ